MVEIATDEDTAFIVGLPLGPEPLGAAVQHHVHCVWHAGDVQSASCSKQACSLNVQQLPIAAGQLRCLQFLTFLRLIDKEVPPDLDILLIADNYATHKHAKVKAWLAARPRYHLHFTPTYSSWLNQVERWFGLISHQALRRGTFTSMTDLIRRIHDFTNAHNAAAKPFVWVATTQSILDKIERLSTRIFRQVH